MTSPLKFTIRRLENYEDFKTKSEQTSKLLGAAFAEDIFTAIVTNFDSEFYGDFQNTTIIAAVLGGDAYVAEDENGAVVGVSAWFPPGRALYDSEDQQKLALGPMQERFLSKTPGLWAWWGQVFLPTYSTFVEESLGVGVKHDSWHLLTLAVTPEHQRKGIGRALVDVVRAKAKGEGKKMCLEVENSTNLAIYEKLGFVVKGEKYVKGLKGGFNIWPMQADPSA